MKKLLLLRHAKSDWSAGTFDHDRPLNRRGKGAAQSIGIFLERIRQVPDIVVSSSALRARTTVELAKQSGGWPCPIRTTERLYGARVSDVVHLLRGLEDQAKCALLAGHQPTWSELGAALVGGGQLKFVTASLACFDLPIDSWSELQPGIGCLAWLVTPKLLQRAGLG